jgi:uncharacterized protein involved in exopolysaccharide biosynthesis
MATLQTLPEATTLLPEGARSGSTTIAVRSFLYAVFKHRRLVLGVFLLVVVASAVAAVIRPQMWRVNTKVLVKLGETVQLAPAESPSKSIALPLSQEVVKTEAEIVKSAAVVKEAVRRVGVKPEPGTSLEELIEAMQRALTVQPTPGSNVLQISYVGRNPERAANMVNAITDVYIDEHNRVYRNEGVHDFYTAQLKTLLREKKTAQHRLRSYLKQEGIVDIDQEIQVLNQDVLDQEKTLKTHRAKITGTERRLQQVRGQLAATPPQIAHSEEYLLNPTLERFKSKLADLEIERNALLQRYLPADRTVQDKEDEIAKLRNRLREEQERVLNKATVGRNELYGDLQRNVFTLEVNLADLQAREPGLVSRLESTRKHLHELRDKRFNVLNLKQEAEERSYAVDLYRKKQVEARAAEAMTNQSMVNVSVVERAWPPLEPENGLLLPLLLGLISGAGLAAGMAVAVEYLNRRLRFEEEVERCLELPVLAVIPDLETTADIARA